MEIGNHLALVIAWTLLHDGFHSLGGEPAKLFVWTLVIGKSPSLGYSVIQSWGPGAAGYSAVSVQLRAVSHVANRFAPNSVLEGAEHGAVSF